MEPDDDVRRGFEETAQQLKQQRERDAAPAAEVPSVPEKVEWLKALLGRPIPNAESSGTQTATTESGGSESGAASAKFSYAFVNDTDADEAIYDTLARLGDVPGEKFHQEARKKLGNSAPTLKAELRRRRDELAAEAEARTEAAPDNFAIETPVIVRFAPPYSACEWPTSLARALYYEKQTPAGPVPVKLTNFDAEIVEQRDIDDGAEQRMVFILRGSHNGRKLPDAEVPAARLDSMSWVLERWGAELAVMPGHKERASVAIRLLSCAINKQVVFAHTGWQIVDLKPLFLHRGGAIGAAGELSVTVDLGGRAVGAANLDKYDLKVPKSDEEARAAIRASFRALDAATPTVGIPVFAAVYLAPLRELFPPGLRPKLSIFLYGPTGTLKTTFSVIAMAHYGPFTDDSLPASFSATANALEKCAFLAKDVLLVVDDYHPASSSREEQKMADTMQRFLRGVGNSSGRGRMNADGSLRPEYRPRCVGLISGERLPAGASTLARAFIVPIEKGSIRKDKLSEAQASAAMLPIAMGGYVQSLAQQWDDLVERLPVRFRELRIELQGSALHLRQPEQVAYLLLGLEMFLAFAVERKAIDINMRDKRLAEARDTLSALACEHAAVLREDDPASFFLALLRDGIVAQRIFLEAERGDAPKDATAWGWSLAEPRSEQGQVEKVRRPANGRRVGFVDEDWVYLIPEEAHRFAVEAARGSDRLFPVESKTLWRRLDEAGLIQCKDDPGHGRRRVVDRHITAVGKTTRVVMLTRAAFAGGPPLTSDTGDSGETGETHPNHPSAANGADLDRILADCVELDITLKLQDGKLAFIGDPPSVITRWITENMAALIAWLEDHGGEFPPADEQEDTQF